MKYKSISIKIIVLGFVLSLTTFSNSIAKTRYWSMEKKFPTTKEEVINKYFKNTQKLWPLEGIWLQEDLGIIAIVKDPSTRMLYHKYIIENLKDSSLNGTLDGTFTRTKFLDRFILFERSKKKNSNQYQTVLGKVYIFDEKNIFPRRRNMKEVTNLKRSQKKILEFLKVLKESKKVKVSIVSSKAEKNLQKKYTLTKIFP